MKLDVSFFKPFIDGTSNTLKIQCNLDARPDKSFLKNRGPKTDFQIAGVIGLSSKTFAGTISICFPKAVFLKIMNNMLGENYTQINEDVQDGAAEVLNMIFGQAKHVLNEAGHEIQKAIPAVVKGEHIETLHLSGRPVIVIPFVTEAGTFHVEIAIEEN